MLTFWAATNRALIELKKSLRQLSKAGDKQGQIFYPCL
jgi:hypothetical protein